jgi:hypothetical protein
MFFFSLSVSFGAPIIAFLFCGESSLSFCVVFPSYSRFASRFSTLARHRTIVLYPLCPPLFLLEPATYPIRHFINSPFATFARSGFLVISALVPTVGLVSAFLPLSNHHAQLYDVLWNLH